MVPLTHPPLCQCCYNPAEAAAAAAACAMQPVEGYGTLPMDLHVSPQGYHPYYRKGVQDEGPAQVAVHSRILEMRKEKSRDAARSRRGKENYEFYELAKMLPLPAAITTQLDKASIIRLTISYLRLRDFSSHGDPPWNRDSPPPKSLKSGPMRNRSIAMDIFEQHQGTHILQSLDGFAFSLGSDGRFLYISETVSIYLGLSQVEMTGSSVFDYTHQQDHAEVAEQLGINLNQSNQSLSSPGSGGSDDGSTGGPSTPTAPTMQLSNNSSYRGLERAFCVRMKSTLTKRGCHFKSSGYRVLLVLCHCRPQYTFSHTRKQPPQLLGVVALAIALPPPSVNEVRLESDMFVLRLNFDFRIAHCEPRVSDLLDYTPEELTGKNMYTLCYGQDVQKLRKCHTDLMHKGQVMSGYYRIINKNGGFTWIQTCATVICNSKNSEEQSIICVNYVLSGIEYKNCVMDCSQLRHASDLKPDDQNNSEQDSAPDKDGDPPPPKDAENKRSPRAKDGHAANGSDSGHSERSKKRLDSVRLTGESCRSADTNPISRCREDPSPNIKPLEIAIEPSSLPFSAVSEKVSGRGHKMDAHHHRKRKGHSEAAASSATSSSTTDPGPSPPPAKARAPSDSSLTPSPLGGNGNRFLPGQHPANSAVSSVEGKSSPAAAVNGVDGGSSCSPRSSGRAKTDEGEGATDRLSVGGGAPRHWKRPSSTGSSYGSNDAAMSVRDLEDVMNKHLPANANGEGGGDVSKAHPSRGATIQWIGGTQPATLPASSFLRQLYVNRESVIRSGSHVSRPTTYYSDVQGTLPTPPGSGGGAPGVGNALGNSPGAGSVGGADLVGSSYGEQPQFMLQTKVGGEPYGLVQAYSVASVAPSSVYMDTYSAMTPPASVSPREKFHAAISDTATFSEAASAAAAAAIPHMRHYSEGLSHLPLKPQVFVHPGSIESSYGHPQPSLAEQHALYTNHVSSFHLYHPGPGPKTTHHPHHAPNGSAWYPQPNS